MFCWQPGVLAVALAVLHVHARAVCVHRRMRYDMLMHGHMLCALHCSLGPGQLTTCSANTVVSAGKAINKS